MMSLRLTNAHLVRRVWLNGLEHNLWSDGMVVPIVAGAAPDDDETDDEGNVTDKDESTKDESKNSDDGDQVEDDESSDAKVRSEEAKRYRLRMKAEKDRADELAAKLKAIEDKDKTELERATARVEELERGNKELEDSLRAERVRVAFFAANTVTWHDPEDALSAVDLSEVDVSPEGKVNTKQLKAAIKALADRKPHWVRQDSSPEGSGSTMNGKRKGESDKPDRAALEKDFPALRNR